MPPRESGRAGEGVVQPPFRHDVLVGDVTVVGEQLPEPAQVSEGGREAAVVEHRAGWVNRTVGVLFRAKTRP